jgi:guanylate kinase
VSGNIFIVAAPSGAGKSSLVNAVLAEDANVQLSVSYTTRPPRTGEVHGREYHFTDLSTFQAMVDRGEFMECAEVHGNRYGTSQKWIAETQRSGRDIVLEIDWQGAQQVRRLFPATVSIFILPPSLPELERRLRTRGKDSEDAIQQRMRNARDEICHAAEFDYVIINKDFDEAKRDLAAIIRAARLRSSDVLLKRDTPLPGIIPELLDPATRRSLR